MLAAHEKIVDVSVFGTTLHVHLAESDVDPVAAIREILSPHDVRIESAREVPAGLEDAFLYLTDRQPGPVDGGTMNARRTFSLLVFTLGLGRPRSRLTARLSSTPMRPPGLAIEASTLTTAAADRLEATEFAVKAADGARLPVVSVNAAVARQNGVPEFAVPSDQPGQPPLVLYPNIENTYSADLMVNQPIYTGGAISANREAARMDESAATWSQSLTALDLGYVARMDYWSAVGAAAGVDVAEAQVKRTRRLLEDARALREAGMAVNADVFAAEARVSAAEVDVIRARNAEEQSWPGSDRCLA